MESPSPGSCINWSGPRSSEGYGKYGSRYAHRVAWSKVHGPIPTGMQIDHLCRNRLCVNIDHLEAVSHAENILRGSGFSARNARKTHCVRGHEFTPENTMVRPSGARTCRACYRLVAKARYNGIPVETFSPRTRKKMF